MLAYTRSTATSKPATEAATAMAPSTARGKGPRRPHVASAVGWYVGRRQPRQRRSIVEEARISEGVSASVVGLPTCNGAERQFCSRTPPKLIASRRTIQYYRLHMCDSSPARRATLLMATGWLMLIFAAPLLYIADFPASLWLYRFFDPVCHQIADRSFALMNVSLPVCARCFGLYTGFWAGLVVLPSARFLARYLERQPRLILLFSIPLLIDLVTYNTHWTRFASGLLASAPFPIFVCKAFDPLIFAFRRAPRGTS